MASRADFLASGWSDSDLRAAVRSGRLERAAPGWYARLAADPRVLTAVRHGYRPTCLDALELHGVWTPARAPGDDTIHVFHPRAGRTAPRGLLPHGGGPRTWTGTSAVAPPLLALRHAMRCLDGESAAIVLESSMVRGLCSPTEIDQLLRTASVRTRSRIGILSTGSESGSETRVVRSLRRAGYRVEQQVYVEDVGFVDAYVAGLFLEIDGRAHHSDPAAFERDRSRDLALRRRGLEILRLSYRQVWREWSKTWPALLAAINRLGPGGRRSVETLRGSGAWCGVGATRKG